MNEAVRLKLKIVVERAVRPVKASLPWKMKVREELIAHLTAVYEDELLRGGDETAASIMSVKRFGDPDEISRTLQKSLPASERFASFMDALLEPRSGESWIRLTARYVSLMIAYVAILAVLRLASSQSKRIDVEWLSILICFAVLLGGMIAVVSVLSNQLQKAWSARSFFQVIIVLIVSNFVPVFLPAASSMFMSPVISVSDALILAAKIVRISLPATPLGPLVVILAAKVISDGRRYREEWSNLQID